MAYQKKKELDFRNHPIESFLFIDIETVAKVKELEENTPLYDSFVYKMRYTEEAQRKDFNSYNVKALFAEKAALYPEFGKIVCITVGKIIGDQKIALHSFSGDDEAKILTGFTKALGKWVEADSNIALCGINLKFFDLRFMFIRGVIHQIPSVIGHIDLTGLKPWELFTADLTDIWKQTSPYNAPMVCMAESLGLPSPKSDIDGSQVSSTYYKEGEAGLKRIVEYCERDVFTTANIAMKLRYLPLLEVAKPEEKEEAKAQAEDELPPFLQKFYNMNQFTPQLAEELKDIIGKKRLTKADKVNLKTILLGVYVRNDFINRDQDTKAVIEDKTNQIDEFIASL